MTLGDLIGFMSLVVAMQTLMFTLHMYIHNKYKEKQDKEIRQIINNTFMIKKSHQLFIATLIKANSSFRLHSSILHRLMMHIKLDSDLTNRISKSFLEYEDLFNKSLHELIIIDNNPGQRDSSVRQLSQINGDIFSYELMCEVNRHEENKDPLLKKGIADLRRRLDNSKKK